MRHMNGMRSQLQTETQLWLLMSQLLQALVEDGRAQFRTIHANVHNIQFGCHLAERSHVFHAGFQHVECQLHAHIETMRFGRYEIRCQRTALLIMHAHDRIQ